MRERRSDWDVQNWTQNWWYPMASSTWEGSEKGQRGLLRLELKYFIIDLSTHKNHLSKLIFSIKLYKIFA